MTLRAVPVTGTGGVGMIGEPVCLKGVRPAAGSTHRFHRSFFFMLRIRLTRTGRKKRPSYRVVVAEARWARDGRRIAELGYYDPLTDPSTIRLDVAATEDWIRKGAQPSDRVRKLLAIAKTVPQQPAATAGPSA